MYQIKLKSIKRTKLNDKLNDESSLNRSKVYQEFLAERDEILKHKWLESEKVGHDIGYEKAMLDWIIKHRDKWRSTRRPHI